MSGAVILDVDRLYPALHSKKPWAFGGRLNTPDGETNSVPEVILTSNGYAARIMFRLHIAIAAKQPTLTDTLVSFRGETFSVHASGCTGRA